MKCAFIGNWNNWPLAVATHMCSYCSNYHAIIINTRNDIRNHVLYNTVNFSSTNSKLQAVNAFLNFNKHNISRGDFLLNSHMLEAIEWADVIFVSGEFLFLASIITNKSVISLPIGFDIEYWYSLPPDKRKNASYFEKSIFNCDLHVNRNDCAFFLRDFFNKPELSGNRFRFPSPPIPYDVHYILQKASKNIRSFLHDLVNTHYIFYATRISDLSNSVAHTTSDKGSNLFLEALGSCIPQIKASHVKLVFVKTSSYCEKSLECLDPELKSNIILLPQLEYHEFIHCIKYAALVIESVGANTVSHYTASDAISQGTPVLSSFHCMKEFQPQDFGLNDFIFDSSKMSANSLLDFLVSFLQKSKVAEIESDESKRLIEKWPRVITDKKFAIQLHEKLLTL